MFKMKQTKHRRQVEPESCEGYSATWHCLGFSDGWHIDSVFPRRVFLACGGVVLDSCYFANVYEAVKFVNKIVRGGRALDVYVSVRG